MLLNVCSLLSGLVGPTAPWTACPTADGRAEQQRWSMLRNQLHRMLLLKTPSMTDCLQAAKLEGQANDKAAAVAVIQGTDERDLWRRDLDALLETLDAEDAKMDKRASLLAKQKTAAGGRKVGLATKHLENPRHLRRRVKAVVASAPCRTAGSDRSLQGSPPASQPVHQLLECWQH
jgi:hypothetical protein